MKFGGLLLPVTLLCTSVLPGFGQNAPHKHHHHHAVRMVAYDAKDKRWYSVAYAKAHHWHDRGGDKLTLIPFSHLPKGAKMSRAMLKESQKH